MTGGADALARVGQEERARIVGSLSRRFRDLGLAEDAVQEAFAAAARRWPVDGVPDRPGAWLTTTAYRKAIGILRRRRPTVDIASHDGAGADEDDVIDAVHRPASDDDLFSLVLTCCHPALAPEARIALTLRHVCGLGVAEIAAAFLVAEPAMAKRLVRAREKIRRAAISFDPPTGAALDDRLDDVRTVAYLVFNEGYLASDDAVGVRRELCAEGLWLARHLHALRPDDETAGLFALLLVHHARRDARQDPTGRLVPLPEQERGAWDTDAIGLARRVLSGTSGRVLGPYQVEAAIALLHVADGGPDWARLADLHGVLSRLAPSPVVEVNRALAVGYADGAPSGLAVLEPVLAAGRLDRYAPLHAVHGELLELLGDPGRAVSAWERGAEVATNPLQRSALRERADGARRRLGDGDGDGDG